MATESGTYSISIQTDPDAAGLLNGGDFNIEVEKDGYSSPLPETVYLNLNTEFNLSAREFINIYNHHIWDSGATWGESVGGYYVNPEYLNWEDEECLGGYYDEIYGDGASLEKTSVEMKEILRDIFLFGINGSSQYQGIIRHLEKIFNGYNIDFVTSRDSLDECTTVNISYYITDGEDILNGFSQRIDVGNQYNDNVYISGQIYGSDFSRIIENYALAIAHELGHSYGLSHAINSSNDNIMSYVDNPVAFSNDTQYYSGITELLGGEYIWGVQDSSTILDLTLGSTANPPSDHIGNTFADATIIAIGDAYNYEEYVGYGDAYDYYTFDVSNPGQFNIALTELDSKVMLGLYVFDGAKYKKVKSASAKTDKVTGETAAVLEDILLDNGTYYLEVASGDKGKGKCNTNYTLDITPDFLPPKSDDEFDFKTGAGTPEVIVLNAQDDATTSGWVGFGDPQDVYIFDVANAGVFNIDLTDLDARAGIAIYYEDDSKGSVTYKRAKSAGAKYDKITGETVASLGNLLLNSGTYYLEVISGDKGKGRDNTNYTLNIDGNTFPEATDDNYDFKDMLGDFNIIDLDNGGDGLASGWVGFGDCADVYCFTPDSSGLYDIALAGLTAKTNMSVWYFDEAKGCFKSISKANGSEKTGSALINDFNLTGGVNYYIAIESGDKGKGKCNSYYELNVDGTYIDLGGDFSNAPVDVGDFGEFAGKKRKSLIGNEWIGMADATDYYGFEIADYYYYNGQRYDFNDPVWVKMEFDISGDAVIEFSMLDKNGSVIDSTFVIDVNEKGTDGVLQLDWIYPGEYFLKVEAISGGAEYTMYGFGNDYEIADPPWVT